MSREVQELAQTIWGYLSGNDATPLHQVAATIRHRDMSALIRALGYPVASCRVDPPPVSSWLSLQWAGRGADPCSDSLPGAHPLHPPQGSPWQ